MKAKVVYFYLFLSIALLVASTGCSHSTEPSPISNAPPEIVSLSADKTTLYSGEFTLIICEANDPDGDKVSYNWISTGGSFNNTTSSSVIWYAPTVTSETDFKITVLINDSENSEVLSDYITITVLPKEPDILSLTLYPTDDAYVSSIRPENNYGGEKSLNTGQVDFGVSGVSNYYSYIKFDISSIPSNIEIINAEFILITGYNNTATKPTGDVYLFYVSNSDWDESSITYANRPTASDYVITINRDVIFDIVTEQRFDIEWHLDDYLYINSKYSLMVKTGSLSTTYDYAYFYSKEVSKTYSPKLYIEYIEK